MIARIATRLAAAAICLSTAACASVGADPRPTTVDLCEVAEAGAGAYRSLSQPLEGVVASSERGEVYHRNDAGDLIAISMETGAELWRRSAGPAPWWHAGDRLFALAWSDERGPVHLEALDLTRDGSSLGRSGAIEFPAGARPDAEAAGISFGLTVRRSGSIATVAWWAVRRVVRGVPAQPGVVAEPERWSGRFTFDERSLEVTDGCAEAAGERSEDLDIVSERYWTGQAWETRPFRVEEGLFSLRAAADGEEGLFLVRHDSSGESLSRLAADPTAWRRISADGRLVLIQTETRGTWRVVPLASPAIAVDIEVTDTLIDVQLVGGALVVLVQSAVTPFDDAHRGMLPRALVAFDSITGEPRWRTPTRSRQLLPVSN